MTDPHLAADGTPILEPFDPNDPKRGLDLSELIRHLKSLVKYLHPDGNSGNFRNEAERAAFLEATAALKMAEDVGHNSRALTVRSDSQVIHSGQSREVSQHLRDLEVQLAQDASDRKERVAADLRGKTVGIERGRAPL